MSDVAEAGREYFIGIDPAGGPDRAAIMVFRQTPGGLRFVAEFAEGLPTIDGEAVEIAGVLEGPG